jgi:type II secretory pathway component PulK
MLLARNKCKSRGAALLLVLGAMAILAVLAVELSQRANLDVSRAGYHHRLARFRMGFNAGVEVARASLAQRREGSADHFGAGWQNLVRVELTDTDWVEIRISDESGKLQIPPLPIVQSTSIAFKASLNRLFDSLCRVEPRREAEWRETEKRLLIRTGLSPDTVQAPRPLLTLDALREAGIDRQIVFGDNTPEGESRALALCDVLTTFGDGKININTANAAVLYAMDEELMESMAQGIVSKRGTTSSDGSVKHNAYQKTAEIEAIDGIVVREMVDGQLKEIRNLHTKLASKLSVQSACFSVRMTVSIDKQKREAWAFLIAPNAGSVAGKAAAHVIAFEEIGQ